MSYGTLTSLIAGQATGDQAPGGVEGLLMQLFPFVLIIVVFYFLLIRPQQKRAKEHAAMLAAIKIGDEVITTGGLVGRVSGLTDNYVTLEIAQGVKVRVVRVQLVGLKAPEGANAESK